MGRKMKWRKIDQRQRMIADKTEALADARSLSF
jgi:hypothetical protein